LPDGDAFDFLQRRVAETATASRPFALALTAELDADLEARLLDAGFDSVSAKPLHWDTLRALSENILGSSPIENPAVFADPQAVASGEPSPCHASSEVLDDAAALRACGSRENVTALRRLLASELPDVLDGIAVAQRCGDHAGVAAALHRLRSSCGFCGATSLGDAIARVAVPAQGNDARQSSLEAVLLEGTRLLGHLESRV